VGGAGGPRSKAARRRKPLPPAPSPKRGGGENTRPLFLKAPRSVAVVSIFPGGSPQRFEWRDRHYLVERSWGPERIETGWWRGDDIRRDYFIVEATTGERFWLFRNLIDGSWFLHGAFE
jgi:protein ImuB